MKQRTDEALRAKAYVDRVIETQRKFGFPPTISEEEYREAVAAAKRLSERRTRTKTAIAA